VRGLALLGLLVALGRPQLSEGETADVEGIDIVIAFDMSGSMKAIDLSLEELNGLRMISGEVQDRFDAGIDVLRNFVESREYDRVSLVVFGEEAMTQFPLTLDYGVILRILERMELGDVPPNGTVIGNALAVSLNRLEDSSAATQLVILITDGEENGSNFSPREMAEKAKERGVRIFPILVGREGETLLPGRMGGYEVVPNGVNPELLQEIAEIADGQFFRSSDKTELEQDLHTIIDEFEKSRIVDYAAAEKTELFQWFLWPAFALLFFEVLLTQVVLRRFP